MLSSENNKKVNLEIKDGKLIIQVDANKDGEAVLVIAVDLSEVADEVIDLFKKESIK